MPSPSGLEAISVSNSGFQLLIDQSCRPDRTLRLSDASRGVSMKPCQGLRSVRLRPTKRDRSHIIIETLRTGSLDKLCD